MLLDVVDSVLGSAVNLRCAAQGVSILYADFALTGGVLAAVQQTEKVLRSDALAVMRTNLVYSRLKCIGNTVLCLEAECIGDIGNLRQLDGIIQCQSADRSHSLGTVVQCKAFLCAQNDRSDACSLHGLAAVDELALIISLAHADHNQNHVGQRSQVAGSAQGSLLRDERGNALVQHVNHGLHGLQTDTGEALGKVIHTKKHDASCHILRERIAAAYCVGDDQISLKLCALILADNNIAELAETGGDTVYGLLLCNQFIDNLSGFQNLVSALFGKLYKRVVAAHSCNLINREVLTCDDNFFHDLISPFPYKMTMRLLFMSFPGMLSWKPHTSYL